MAALIVFLCGTALIWIADNENNTIVYCVIAAFVIASIITLAIL